MLQISVCIVKTHHDSNVPYIYTIGPGNIEYDFRCSIDVRLNIVIISLFPKTGFSKVAQHWATGLLGAFKAARLIDHTVSLGFTRAWTA